MFILYAVHYPDRELSRLDVENAWTGAGLPQPVPALASDTIDAAAAKALVRTVLDRCGAVPLTGRNGAMEVPDDAEPVLEELEEFYHRLYPETRTGSGRDTFYYERLEWLGEF